MHNVIAVRDINARDINEHSMGFVTRYQSFMDVNPYDEINFAARGSIVP